MPPRPPKGNKFAEKHGHWRRKKALKKRGLKAIDRRTTEGKWVFEHRANIIADIGGAEMLIEGKEIALDFLTGIVWDVLDIARWKREYRKKHHGSLVNNRSKSYPAVVPQQYKAIEAAMKLLDKIYGGQTWERRQKMLTLQDILAESEPEVEAQGNSDEEQK
jgi:hypothetical protein